MKNDSNTPSAVQPGVSTQKQLRGDREAALYLGVSAHTVFRLRHQGRIPHYYFCGSNRAFYLTSELDGLFQAGGLR